MYIDDKLVISSMNFRKCEILNPYSDSKRFKLKLCTSLINDQYHETLFKFELTLYKILLIN